MQESARRLLLALGAAAAHGISLGKWTNTQYASEQGARPPHSPSSVSATLSHHPPSRAVGLPCPLLPDFKPQVVGWAGHHEWNSRITFARWQPGAKLWLDFGVNGPLESFYTNAPVVTNHEDRVLELDVGAIRVVNLHFTAPTFNFHRSFDAASTGPVGVALFVELRSAAGQRRNPEVADGGERVRAERAHGLVCGYERQR